MAKDLTLKLRLAVQDEGVAAALARVAASAVGMGRELNALGDRSGRSVERLRVGLDSISRQLAGMQRLAQAAFVTMQGAGAVGSIVRTATEWESLQAAMRAVFGTAEAARGEMQFLRTESERLGVPLQVLAQQWLSFAAAARGTTLEGQRAREAFVAISEAATVLGLSGDQLAGALLAVQQMISKGAVSSEELRQQLGERLFGAVQVAARAVGLTSEAFNDLLERGMVPVERFLPAFAAQLRREFGGSAADAANTARAAFARLENSLLELRLQFARSGFMDAIVDAARSLTEAFKDEGFRQSVREFGALIGALTRFLIDHADKLVVLGGALAGARAGAAAGRLAGPKGALAGAVIGGVAGGLGAASMLPERTAAGDDAQRVREVEAAVDRLRRRIEETRRASAAGLLAAGEAQQRIAQDEARIKELMARTAPPAAAATDADGKLGPALQWDAMLKQYRAANDRLQTEIERARAIGRALGKPAAEIEALIARIRASIGDKGEDRARAELARAAIEAELSVMREGLARAQEALDASLNDRLVSLRDYYARKTAIEQREIDAAIDATRQQLAAQKALERSALQEADRLRARGEVAKLEAELIVLNSRRAAVEQANARAAAQAERQLGEELARARDELAQMTGTETAEQRRAAIARQFADLRARLLAQGDTGGVSIVDRLIDVRAAAADLEAIEARFRQTMDRMRADAELVRLQQEAGLLSETRARQRIVALQRQAADEAQRLLPAMQRAAQAVGPEAELRVRGLTVELARLRTTADEFAAIWQGIGGAFASAFDGMITRATTWRDAMQALFVDVARVFRQELVLKPMQEWIAAQARMLAVRLGLIQQQVAAEKAAAAQSAAMKAAEAQAHVSAEAAKAGAGAAASQASIPIAGPVLAIAAMAAMVAAVMALMGKIRRFAAGGTVPGHGDRDTVPAMLTPGEYVIRRQAVRRVGVRLLDAINGLRVPPPVIDGRLAFAAGGMVPSAPASPSPAATPQHVRIVNAIDPSFARDWLQSPAGERVILNVIGRNATAVRNILL